MVEPFFFFSDGLVIIIIVTLALQSTKRQVRCQRLGNSQVAYFDPGDCACFFETREDWVDHARLEHQFDIRNCITVLNSLEDFFSWFEQLQQQTGCLMSQVAEHSYHCQAHTPGQRPGIKCYAYAKYKQLANGQIEVINLLFHFRLIPCSLSLSLSLSTLLHKPAPACSTSGTFERRA